MADTILNIQTGAIDAPYQEFTETIPAGGCRKINYVTENFALLETSAPEALHVNFGGSSNETPFLAGMRYKLPAIVPNITLFNRSKTDLTVHFAVGCGEIDDNRLTVVSSINTVSTFSHFKTEGVTFSTSSCLIKTTGEKIVLQNNGSNDLYICDARPRLEMWAVLRSYRAATRNCRLPQAFALMLLAMVGQLASAFSQVCLFRQ